MSSRCVSFRVVRGGFVTTYAAISVRAAVRARPGRAPTSRDRDLPPQEFVVWNIGRVRNGLLCEQSSVPFVLPLEASPAWILNLLLQFIKLVDLVVDPHFVPAFYSGPGTALALTPFFFFGSCR
ncbi:hypothetical protein EVAR_92604_1 [Eumeta japonica]|uniref:Uncharacterized protein n=1 Tax=Eumeta variegata TaxID=151549 RepID=A0A4C1SZK7_EUMVA|nr:hypothetical protein EVAR_92604_1 [Eumeta japonica]